MEPLVDDVGSFPLPDYASGEVFDEAYRAARKAIIEGQRNDKDEFLLNNFSRIVLDSFRKKVDSGLDVVNYPQHYGMEKQVAEAIRESMNEGTYLINQERAILPEVCLINDEAKKLSEETGETLKLRVCIIGPIELYLKEMGSVVHEDVLQAFAENVRRFAKNSILNSKYVQTFAVSLDEPSYGFQDILADREIILETFETAFNFNGVTRQIHLHSPSRIADLLNVKNIDALSIEYAGTPKNLDSVSKSMLEQNNKQVRVGVTRTDINSIVSELYDRGITKPSAGQIVEDEKIIGKRFETALNKYGDRMTFTGPDCGLGGWPSQEAAQLLLARTVKAVKAIKNKLKN